MVLRALPTLVQEEAIPSEAILDRLMSVRGIYAAAIFAGSVLLALIINRAVQIYVDRKDSEHFVAELMGRLTGAVIVAIGLIYALRALAVPIGPLLGALGIGGLAIAFALQEVLSNIFAGMLLQTRRPFLRGDQILTNEYEGVVRDVNMRAVVLHTYEGQRVYVPNLQVLKNPIVNYTALRRRRTTIVVGVAYDTDLRKAERVIIDALEGVDEIRDHPSPEAWVEEFGESTINFAARYWHEPDILTTFRVRHHAAVAIKEAFDREGITIAFPQMTVWLGDPERVRGVVRGDGG